MTIKYKSDISSLPSNKLDETILTFEFGKSVPPVMAPSDSWYKSSIDKSTITSITFEQDFTNPNNLTIQDSWDASVTGDNSITVYKLSDNSLIITGNGRDKIYANPDSSYLFTSFAPSIYYFGLGMSIIDNLNYLDISNVVDMSYMFYKCSNLPNYNSKYTDKTKGYVGEGGYLSQNA